MNIKLNTLIKVLSKYITEGDEGLAKVNNMRNFVHFSEDLEYPIMANNIVINDSIYIKQIKLDHYDRIPDRGRNIPPFKTRLNLRPEKCVYCNLYQEGKFQSFSLGSERLYFTISLYGLYEAYSSEGIDGIKGAEEWIENIEDNMTFWISEGIIGTPFTGHFTPLGKEHQLFYKLGELDSIALDLIEGNNDPDGQYRLVYTIEDELTRKDSIARESKKFAEGIVKNILTE